MNSNPSSIAQSYQEPLDVILAAPVPTALRSTALLLAGCLACLIASAAATRLDIVVTGPGVLSADHPTAVLQAIDRGMIRTLRVRAGDHVRQGEILATLDPTFVEADLHNLQAQQRMLIAEVARLSAERDGANFKAPDGTDEAKLQEALFQKRREAQAAKLEEFDRARDHAEAEIATARAQLSDNWTQSHIYDQIRAMRKSLLLGAVGSRLQFLESEAAASRSEAMRDEVAGHIAELFRATESSLASRRAFIADWQRDIADALAQKRAALAQTEAAVTKASRLQALAVVRAPEDGIVLSVAPRAPGSTLGPDQPLLTLLPARAGLTAEITIRSADVGYLRTGQDVEIQVDAFRAERHGVLHGRVRAVTEASEPSAAGGAIHRVSIELDGPGLINLPPGTGPLPGMTVSGSVRVGSRSALAYFLAPITRGFAQSLREP